MAAKKLLWGDFLTEASLILTGGHIRTMDDKKPLCSAVAVSGGRIIATGSDKEMLALKGANTRIVELGGRVIYPGFIDAHGHFLMNAVARYVFTDVSCAPIGTVTSIDTLLDRLKEKNTTSKVVGFGFDDTLIPEYRMPTRQDLDRVSTEKSVIVLHTSLHMLSANTYALKRAGVFEIEGSPPGGVINRDENGDPTGVLEESAALGPLMKQVLGVSLITKLSAALKRSSDEYLRAGVTTACEGLGSGGFERVYKLFSSSIEPRVIYCPGIPAKEDVHLPKPMKGRIVKDGKLLNGPVKLLVDGSIQAYTGYLSKPYYTMHPTRPKPDDYTGYPAITEERLTDVLAALINAARPFCVHCNGDLAIETLLDTYERLAGTAQRDVRKIIVHCQMVTDTQLRRMYALGFMPTFFPSHCYVWGDRHLERFLGEERGMRLNPLASAVKAGLRISIHNDSPVTDMNPIKSVWAAVNRVTPKGRIMGEDQRVLPETAMRAVTCDAAYQYGIDQKVGSIAPGRYADFTELSADPLCVPPDEILNISVLSTWVGGREVFSR